MLMLWLLAGCASRSEGPPPSVGPWSEDGKVNEYKPVVSDELDRVSYGQELVKAAFVQDGPQLVEHNEDADVPGGRQRGLLSLRVDSEGRLLSVEVSKSCGFEDLDQAVLEQVRSKSSYAAPSPELLDEQGELSLAAVQFSVEVVGASEREWRMLESGARGSSADPYLESLSKRFDSVCRALILERAESINPSTGEYDMVMSAVLDREGQVAHSAIKVSSGLPGLDQAFVDALQAAAPYGAPPQRRLSSDGLYWLPLIPYHLEVINDRGELDFGDLIQSKGWAESTSLKVVLVR